MARIGRPIFRRNETYVAVKPIRLTSTDTIKKGAVVDLPIHRLRSLYMRRRIGPKGHPWTKAMIKADFFPKLSVPEPTEPELKADQLPEAGTDPVKNDKKKWGFEGIEETFKTKKAAVAWLEAQHAALAAE